MSLRRRMQRNNMNPDLMQVAMRCVKCAHEHRIPYQMAVYGVPPGNERVLLCPPCAAEMVGRPRGVLTYGPKGIYGGRVVKMRQEGDRLWFEPSSVVEDEMAKEKTA